MSNRFDIERALWDRKPDDSVSVTVRRDGKERTLTLTLARTEERESAAAPKQAPKAEQAQPAGR